MRKSLVFSTTFSFGVYLYALRLAFLGDAYNQPPQ
jgi:hypothetical protein